MSGRRSRNAADPGGDAEALLAGREPLSARRLLEVIHVVNPTGLDLAPAESARRYALKGRLQSLLIERYREELVVSPEPGDSGVVSLRHRYLGLDACHATLTSLAEGARAWVRFQLDTGAHEEEAPPRCEDPPSRRDRRPARPSKDPLTLGREALSQFDYEAARAAFEDALGRPELATDAAVELLTLLVDVLALDREALALEAELSPPALGQVEVRALLGTAAARVGDLERSARLLRGSTDPRTADACAILARGALARLDLDEAGRLVGDLRARAPGHEALLALEGALAEARARAREPAEMEARELWERGEVDAAEAAARGILGRWPESELARRVLRAATQQRRESSAQELRRGAEEAAARGDTEGAERLARELRALGAPDEALERRVVSAREEARFAAVRVRADALHARAEGGALAEGLRAWSGADAEARSLALARAPAAAYGWLDRALSRGARPGESLVGAILALVDAEAKLAAGDPEGALAATSPHAEALAFVPRHGEVAAEARRRGATLRAARASERLARCAEALLQGDPRAARCALDAVDLQDVPVDQRGEHASLVARVKEAEALASEAERVRALEVSGDLVGARDAVERLVSLPGADLAAWGAKRAELSASLRARWRAQVLTGDDDATDLVALSSELSLDQHAPWRLGAGGVLIHACSGGRWLLVRVLDPGTGRLRRRVLVHTPEAVDPSSLSLAGEVAWFAAHNGWALGLDLGSADIVAWRSVFSPGAVPWWCRKVFFLCGRYAWGYRRQGDRPSFEVVDLAGSGASRILPNTAQGINIQGSPLGVMAIVDGSREPWSLRIFGERGEPRATAPLLHSQAPMGVEGHPTVGGLVVLCAPRSEATRERALHCYCTGPDRRPGALRRILEGWNEQPVALQVARDLGLLYVLTAVPEGTRWLFALEPSGDVLEVAWRVTVPAASDLLGDGFGRRAVLLVAGAEGPVAIGLGASAPELTHLRPLPRRVMPNLGPKLFCKAQSRPVDAKDEILKRVRGSSREAMEAWVLRELRRRQPDAAVDLCREAMQVGLGKVTKPGITILAERFPGRPEVVLLDASLAAVEGRWSEVLTLLAPLEHEALEDGLAAHALHLRGLAQLRLGDPAAACATWASGARRDPGCCGMAAGAELLRPLPDSVLEDASASSPLTLVRLALREAEACLGRGDGPSALRALERPEVIAVYDSVCEARSAAAAMLSSPEGDGARARALVTVGAWVEAQVTGVHSAQQARLPWPEVPWEEDQRVELLARAQAWLEAQDRQGTSD
ncbi:MAG: hypothetical protein HY909_11710 [Deltaproteobacteria bacterium]|nr:hypothetical protein [Deltaproteobacteria bacterium]